MCACGLELPLSSWTAAAVAATVAAIAAAAAAAAVAAGTPPPPAILDLAAPFASVFVLLYQ